MLLPYLAEHPPLHILVAGMAGWKANKASATPDDTAAAMRILGTGRDVHAGMREGVMLDFDRLKAASKGSA